MLFVYTAIALATGLAAREWLLACEMAERSQMPQSAFNDDKPVRLIRRANPASRFV